MNKIDIISLNHELYSLVVLYTFFCNNSGGFEKSFSSAEQGVEGEIDIYQT